MNSILLIGKPNSGKSLLFNRLTGLNQKVANFPGVTVEVKSGDWDDWKLIDYPGVYSFNPLTADEKVSIVNFKKELQKDNVRTVICVLDATRLERSLVLGIEIRNECIKLGKSVVFALNMMDEIYNKKADTDVVGLEKELGFPVIAISAKTKKGLGELKEAVSSDISSVEDVSESIIEQDEVFGLARKWTKSYGPKAEVILRVQNSLDKFFLSPYFGGFCFVFTMVVIFQSIFTWSEPLMSGIETLISYLAGITGSVLPNGIIKDFVIEALFGGVGSFLVFVPQIFVLTFIIGILEDSGYLARAAVICHKPLSFFGLTGKSFVPLLSGHACAIPAVYAARTIESPKKRILTMIAIPLTSCSARLPVYALLVAAVIPNETFLFGLVGLRGATFFALFAFGILMALVVSGLSARTFYKGKEDAPFILEMPPYRMPSWQPLLQRSLSSSWSFVSKAGTVIFTVTVVVWALGYFPHGPGHLDQSWLAYLGRVIEPVFQTMGLDWKFGVAILTSFLAREVFVGTLGTFYGIEGADENIAGLTDQIQAGGLTLASGLSLLVFYAIALQCVSTLAVIRRESGSVKLPIYLFIAYSLIAYVLSVAVFQIFS